MGAGGPGPRRPPTKTTSLMSYEAVETRKSRKATGKKSGGKKSKKA